MIRNKDSKSKLALSFLGALILHAAILSFVKKDINSDLLSRLSHATRNLNRPIKLDQIDFIKKSDLEKIKRVGIKDGKKDLERPDIAPKPIKASPGAGISMESLAPQLPKPEVVKKPQAPQSPSAPNPMAKNFIKASPNDSGGHFYFNSKEQKVIPHSQEQESLKEEAIKNVSAPMNKATEKISNFEIRYERPEGVSVDELNSDEKAYYSFYVRSYQNYFSKIYSNYEKIVIEKPGLANVFDKKHLLIGKIDYDEKGNIITVRILKSSESDDLHYFFEETLKQLSQPNPPKIFTRNRKQFSIYYQLQIN